MSKHKSKNNNLKQKNGLKIHNAVSNETDIVLAQNYVELQAEAYYRAMKRLKEEEEQKGKVQKEIPQKKKRWKKVFVGLWSIFIPWFDIGKNRVNNQIYDEILVFPISTLLMWGGTFIYIVGIGMFYINLTTKTENLFLTLMISIFVFLMGSLMVLSGRTFREEKDSMKIYAYSASIIALISCVVSIMALLGE